MKNNLIFKRLDESTLLIEWPMAIDKKTLKKILTFRNELERQEPTGILETYPAYRSLAVHFDQELTTFSHLCDQLNTLAIEKMASAKHNRWVLPVCYEAEYCPDLAAFAKEKKMGVDDVIEKHTSPDYTVHFMGFLPGFMYLGGLDPQLALARKVKPKLAVPKGAVAIGGSQTGIYPSESPGGWHVIGNCPLSFFDPKSENPCFIQSGDTIRFNPVSRQEYKVIRLEVDLDVFDRQSILKNG